MSDDQAVCPLCGMGPLPTGPTPPPADVQPPAPPAPQPPAVPQQPAAPQPVAAQPAAQPAAPQPVAAQPGPPLQPLAPLQPVTPQPVTPQPVAAPPATATPSNPWAPPSQQAPHAGASPGANLPPPQAAPILSPDGYWMWDGAQWVPNNAPTPAGPGYPGGPASPYGAPAGYGGVPSYGAPPRSGTNGMAIASLVLGILWLFGLGAGLAVIFGHISKRQIRERGEGGNGIATAGLILGYLGLGGLVLFIVTVAAAASSLHTVVSGVETSQVRADLRNAATAEETYLTVYGSYTASQTTLEQRANLIVGFGSQLGIAVDDSRGYCIVGSYNGTSGWNLYDSGAGGLSNSSYGSAASAEAACSDPNATPYLFGQ